MEEQRDDVAQKIAEILPRLMRAFGALERFGRQLHPTFLPALVQPLQGVLSELLEARRTLGEGTWPVDYAYIQQKMVVSSDLLIGAIQALQQAADDSDGTMLAYRALRKFTAAVEAIYALSSMLKPVSQYFLEPAFRDDEALIQRIATSDASRDEVGLMQAANSRDERGGVSIYVPEYYSSDKKWPLLVALHGGSGHGADMLWSWVREARSRGFIVLSPSSKDRTWSLSGLDLDAATLHQIVAGSCEQWNIDQDRILLTGMSDGATYTLLQGLPETSPFTHLAPISGTFHPMLLAGLGPLPQKRIYLVHGVLDWMFDVATARQTHESLKQAGAQVVYRELDDLSHTYPRDENSRILDWFLA